MHLRSKIKKLKVVKDGLEVLAAQLKAKAHVDPNVQGFHEQCRKMVASLHDFVSQCVDKQAEVSFLSDSDKAASTKCLEELEALLDIDDATGRRYRPAEQAPIERAHQEVQRSLGMLLQEVVRCMPGEWGQCIPIVEHSDCRMDSLQHSLSMRINAQGHR